MISFISQLPAAFAASHNASQILALSAGKVLQEFGFTPAIKWPNDILLEEKKVAGILADLVTKKGITYLINGIGLNVNSKKEDLPECATSLAAIRGAPLPLQDIQSALFIQYERDLNLFIQEGFAPFYSIYKELLAKPSTLRFHVGKKLVEGRFHSLASNGTLNLELPDGSIRTCFSCE